MPQVLKSSGQREKFSPKKLRHSLRKSGAEESLIEEIISAIQAQIHEDMSTGKIYTIAFQMLKHSKRSAAARYKLKRSIMELGPSGFPFEMYIAELLKADGYFVNVGVSIQGYCVKHEVDIKAERNNKVILIECKYHNQTGFSTDVKVPLYIHSRFTDIERKWLAEDSNKLYQQGWVVTNTNFTIDAIQYGICAGLYMLGWSYPNKDSLKARIDRTGLHPITSLTTITKAEKQRLLDKHIVLCKEIIANPVHLKSVGINPMRIEKILFECHELCDTLKIPGG